DQKGSRFITDALAGFDPTPRYVDNVKTTGLFSGEAGCYDATVPMEDNSLPAGRSSAFPTTQWTVIVEAVSSNPERAIEALNRLCGLYRQPIVNWFKRKDFYEDPEDLA